ncbi:MAG: hypothetical protein JXA92_03015 [candidate division Zixibacteria bacterium]|nr:hypothetical protein [candidate division Zixibacteria bacterium]
MTEKRILYSSEILPEFDRKFFESDDIATVIGTGYLGGKASGLILMKEAVADSFKSDSKQVISVNIPRLIVLATDVFDAFMDQNNLYDMALSEAADDQIAHAFQEAKLPVDIVGDLMALISAVHSPLAIRSSSLLEDAIYEPFAGVYETKMIPNNQPDKDSRFRVLIEAVKFVYASTFAQNARQYFKALGRSLAEEKMAVIIQEVIGRPFGDLFYPHLSGVARSYNYYPTGRAKQEEGVVDLALGLGKTIVDGGLVWTYSPTYPRLAPVVGSTAELVKKTQTEFWAVNMGKPPEYDPIRETEYLIAAPLKRAEEDKTLGLLASTYRPQDDRLVTGTGPDGPRVMTFAPILADNIIPLNETIKALLKKSEAVVGSEVEIEFAVTLNTTGEITANLGFLQVRPMAVSKAEIMVLDEEMQGDKVLAASRKSLGNGVFNNIEDIVYVVPETFEAAHSRTIAHEIGLINQELTAEGRKYLLIGFGRWGSADPWLGIPVVWSQISGSSVIIEATLPKMNVELSQGSHFFHNLISFKICYIMVEHTGPGLIDWTWLESRPEKLRTQFVRHVCLEKPLTVKVDGRTGRGVILK